LIGGLVRFWKSWLQLASFFFAVPSHNANMERIFSLMQVQWTKERSNLNIESIKDILLVQCYYKHLSCKESQGYLKNNQQLLTKMRSTDKYVWARQESELP
jgi:hypothetical protein